MVEPIDLLPRFLVGLVPRPVNRLIGPFLLHEIDKQLEGRVEKEFIRVLPAYRERSYPEIFHAGLGDSPFFSMHWIAMTIRCLQ